MLARWGRAASRIYTLAPKVGECPSKSGHEFLPLNCSKAAATTTALTPGFRTKGGAAPKPDVRLNTLFWSKPGSLALTPDSLLRIEEPQYEGIKRIMLRLLLFYSKQSKYIRGANVVYKRVITQVDRPVIYDVFHLEKTFKTTFSLLVIHIWLVLRRLKEEGKEGVEFGQYLYEIYNQDLELRVSKAGVNLLLTKWMKDLEKIFYGNLVAYDSALKTEAKNDDLLNVVWRNVFSDDGSPMPDGAAADAVKALSRYVRRESTCLSLTDKEAIFSGNFAFTSLENQISGTEVKKMSSTGQRR